MLKNLYLFSKILFLLSAGSVLAGPVAAVTFEDWRATTSFDGPRTSHAAILVGNRLYVLGGLFASGNDFTLYDDVQFAVLGNDGSIPQGSWQRTTAFNIARSGLGSAIFKNYLYVVGGFSKQGTLDDVQYASINPDGTLGAWQTSPHRLNIPRSNHRLEVFTTPSGTPHLAAIAGVGEIGQDTVHYDQVEVAPLNEDGSIGPWRLCPYHLKGGRSAPATIVTNSRLYVFGGWGDLLLEDVFNDVQYAAIRDDGCTEAWHTNPFPLNIPLYGLTSAAVKHSYEITAIVLGGNAGQGNYFNNIQFTTITPSGDTTRWIFDQHQFSVPRWGHVTVLYNDFIYVLGGSSRTGVGFLDDVQYTRVKP
jgi:hypothetical protein